MAKGAAICPPSAPVPGSKRKRPHAYWSFLNRAAKIWISGRAGFHAHPCAGNLKSASMPIFPWGGECSIKKTLSTSVGLFLLEPGTGADGGQMAEITANMSYEERYN